MGMFGSIGKALGGAMGAVGKAPGMGPVNAAVGKVPGVTPFNSAAKPMAGTAQGSVAPAAPAAPGGLAGKLIAAKGLAASPGAGLAQAAPTLAAGAPGMAAGPAVGKKKAFMSARGMAGGRR